MGRGRAAVDFFENLHDEKDAQQLVQPGEAQGCEDHVARVDELGIVPKR